MRLQFLRFYNICNGGKGEKKKKKGKGTPYLTGAGATDAPDFVASFRHF
jgi:hypothetical protein